MKLGMEVGLGLSDFVFDRDPSPPKKGVAQHPHFSAHVCCGQTAGWIKMPLGTEVGLGPGHIVLDGDPAPPPRKRGTAAPSFRPMANTAKRSPISTSQLLLSSCIITAVYS